MPIRPGRVARYLIFGLLVVFLACGRSDEASELASEIRSTSEDSRHDSVRRESARVRSRPVKPTPGEVAEADSAREIDEGNEPDTQAAERAREAADPVFDEEFPEEVDAPAEPPVVFDVDTLLETGLTRAVAEERWDQWQVLDEWQSELTHHARERGWIDTPVYREQRAQINRDFAQRYGDESLREIQKATGQTFIVMKVRSGQPGDEAGIRAGDTIISYDGLAVYDATDFESALESHRGVGDVPVGILRDGRERTVFVPPGFLGIIISGE